FAVEAGEALAVLGDLVAAQIVHLGQQRDDPVEGAGDGVRPALDALLQPRGVAQQPVVALGPAGVVLAVVATVAGMGPDRLAQPGDLPVVGRLGAALAVPLRRDVPGLGAQRRGEVATGLRG